MSQESITFRMEIYIPAMAGPIVLSCDNNCGTMLYLQTPESVFVFISITEPHAKVSIDKQCSNS